MFVGVTSKDEQHIMQNTTAKNRYPLFEKLLELERDLTKRRDSSLSSDELRLKFYLRGLLIEVVEKLSTSSRMFLFPETGKSSI
jgi:hypothetical protein